MIIRRARRTNGAWRWEGRFGDKVVMLSRTQGIVLGALSVHPGSLLPRSELEEAVWGHLEDGGPEDIVRALDVAVANIRDRLASALIPWTIEANWGRGFRLAHVETIRHQSRWAQQHRAALEQSVHVHTS